MSNMAVWAGVIDMAGVVSEALKAELVGRPIGESITAGQELIRDAQSSLAILPPNNYTDLLMQLADGMRDLLEQLRD